jgi:hypothetical protein
VTSFDFLIFENDVNVPSPFTLVLGAKGASGINFSVPVAIVVEELRVGRNVLSGHQDEARRRTNTYNLGHSTRFRQIERKPDPDPHD